MRLRRRWTRASHFAIAYRDRGIVSVGLGAFEAQYPPHLYVETFRRAREGGLGSVPHAGELGLPEAIRDALDLLHADHLHATGSVRSRIRISYRS